MDQIWVYLVCYAAVVLLPASGWFYNTIRAVGVISLYPFILAEIQRTSYSQQIKDLLMIYVTITLSYWLATMIYTIYTSYINPLIKYLLSCTKTKHLPRSINPSYTETYTPDSKFIVVSGIIGAGKTTLTQKLADQFGMNVEYEPVKENPYLPLFYGNPNEYSFSMQIFLLSKRFTQHMRIIWSQKSTVQDRSIYEDPIFAKMLHESGAMTELDFQTYSELFINMTNFLRRPNLIVYLDVTPSVALQRVAQRGRSCERGITLEYLTNLRDGYESWLQDIDGHIPILRVNWDTFNDEFVVQKIKALLKSERQSLVA